MFVLCAEKVTIFVAKNQWCRQDISYVTLKASTLSVIHFLVLQLARQTSRYKVISKNRHEPVDDAAEEKDEVDAGTQEMMRLYQLYDVVLDEAESR